MRIVEEQVRELYNDGYSQKEVASLLGVTKQSVSYHAPIGRKNKKLTFCEREILVAVANGKTSKEIAAEMRLEVCTVDRYKYRMRKKLNIGTTAQLVAWGFKNKYLI